MPASPSLSADSTSRRRSPRQSVWVLLFAIWRYGLLLWVLAALCFAALRDGPAGSELTTGFSTIKVHYSGWPLAYRRHEISYSDPFSQYADRYDSYQFDGLAMRLNIVVSCALLAGAGYASLRLWPRIASRQFALSTMFRLTVVVAVVMCLAPLEFGPARSPPPYFATSLAAYQLITLHPGWVFLPILYALACTIYALTILATAILARWARRRGKSSLTPQTTA